MQDHRKDSVVRQGLLMAAMALVVLGGLVAVTNASPPAGVSRVEIGRGTYQDFKVRTDPKSPIQLQAKAKTPVDFVVRRHEYAVGATTGWHSHPGPVFITVTKGELVYYLFDDPDCTPHKVGAGQGFVDDGRGHIVRNESSEPAEDVSVILAPVGGSPRGELDAPGPHCTF